mgnify:CR=1 FL=1
MYVLSEFIFEPFNSRAKRGGFTSTDALRFIRLSQHFHGRQAENR